MKNPASATRPKAAGLRFPLGSTGLALASASAASAAIVYHPTPPITGSSSFSIDASGNDFTFNFDAGSMGIMDPKFPTPGTPSTFTLTAITGQALITTTPLTAGTTIDGASAYTDYAFVSGGTSYYGFSLVSGQTLYGWMKVTHLLHILDGSYFINDRRFGLFHLFYLVC